MAHRAAVTANINNRITQARNAINERIAAPICNDLQFPKAAAAPETPEIVMAATGIIQRLEDRCHLRRWSYWIGFTPD